jgi:hypothetical protein
MFVSNIGFNVINLRSIRGIDEFLSTIMKVRSETMLMTKKKMILIYLLIQIGCFLIELT